MRRLILVVAITVMVIAIGGRDADACHRRSRQCYSPVCVYYPPPCVCCQPCETLTGNGSQSGQLADSDNLTAPKKIELKKIPDPLPALKAPPDA
ncbi:MAG TPA: hypothetical protein DDY78_21480 [Planctomycetales bacterium]|jgi:hypothetical protein|nr:hypothetical protein [Planctomycetales bacterium]